MIISWYLIWIQQKRGIRLEREQNLTHAFKHSWTNCTTVSLDLVLTGQRKLDFTPLKEPLERRSKTGDYADLHLPRLYKSQITRWLARRPDYCWRRPWSHRTSTCLLPHIRQSSLYPHPSSTPHPVPITLHHKTISRPTNSNNSSSNWGSPSFVCWFSRV